MHIIIKNQAVKKILAFRAWGLVITLGVLVLLELITHNERLRVLGPGTFVLVPVVFSAMREGLMAALINSTIAMLYAAYYYSPLFLDFHSKLHYTQDNAIRLGALTFTMYASAFLTGWLKLRNDKIVSEHYRTLKEQITQAQKLKETQEELAKSNEEVWRAAAAKAESQQGFLSKASQILASSLDYQQTLTQIARLAVPELADWSAIDMFNDENQVFRLAVVHQDPSKIKWAYEISQKYPLNMEDKTGLAKVLKEGVPEFYPEITDEMMVAGALDEEHLKLMKDLSLKSLMIVPLKNLEKTIGAITLVSAESGRLFSEQDLSLATDLARRASLAVFNAKLYNLAERNAANAFRQAQLLNTLLANAPIGFAFLNLELEFVVVNPVYANLGGLPLENYIGKKIYDLFPTYESQMKPHFEQVFETGQPVINFEASGSLPNEQDKIRHWFTSYYPVKNQDNELSGIGMIIQEITEKREAEKEIYFHAYHDQLTKLPNRKAFEERLLKEIHLAKKQNRRMGIMFLDIDRLKNINDGLGHDIGDEVLKEIAIRLRPILRAEDLVARWGGDEFVILLPEIFTASDASRVGEKILAAITPVMRIKNHSLHITSSIGIAMFPADGEDVHTLQKNADIALYRAKESGRNKFEMFAPSMNTKNGENLRLENDLRLALERNEFLLYYQPVKEIPGDKITSVESLLRWQHPNLGLLHPGKFLPIAEELGLIVPIGQWVVRTTILSLLEFTKYGFPIKAAVNISARQFSDENLVNVILSELSQNGCDPRLLDIEITESLAMENLDRTRVKLEQLREYGIGITVDDFGTGYSSLNYLKRLPIDTLKIDKTFVRHMITDEQDTSIIKAIISMAQSLRLKVIAEGVDTEIQQDLLESLGCDAVQGYYVSKPLSKNQLLDYLVTQSQKLTAK